MFKSLKTATAIAALTLVVSACTSAPTVAPMTGTLNEQENQAYSAAIQHFETLVAQKPMEIEATLGLARNLRWAGQAGRALNILEKASTSFKDDGRYQAELGKVHLILGDSSAGVRELDRAATKVGNDWRL